MAPGAWSGISITVAVNKFRNEGHSKDGFAVMNELRKQNTLTDVTLVAEGATFPVHKLVVASCSPYFKAPVFYSEFIILRGQHSGFKSQQSRPYLECRPLIILFIYGMVNFYKTKE